MEEDRRSTAPSLPPNTTAQDDITKAGQRKVNMIWEYTQAIIALAVVLASLIAALVAAMKDKEVSAFLSFVCGNVVGFYFSRTNHQSIGGIGHKPAESQEYLGR